MTVAVLGGSLARSILEGVATASSTSSKQTSASTTPSATEGGQSAKVMPMDREDAVTQISDETNNMTDGFTQYLCITISNIRKGDKISRPEDCFVPFKNAGGGMWRAWLLC